MKPFELVLPLLIFGWRTLQIDVILSNYVDEKEFIYIANRKDEALKFKFYFGFFLELRQNQKKK